MNQIVLELFSEILQLFWVTHHLWYLQVSAPLTSSVMAAESLMSSIITTSGSSPPLSLSIWFARSERYSCNSCESKERWINIVFAYKVIFIFEQKEMRFQDNWRAKILSHVLPFATDDACWRWRQRCDPGRRSRGRPRMSQSGCVQGGSGPDAEPDKSFLSRWTQTEPDAGAWAASWCSAASSA